ncbi:hypothetical protein DFH27DRAFT_557162 [Peziza echinospora]|nr:hypothetical protein DFH27DRAFT_557162 [Peziza echinospora]
MDGVGMFLGVGRGLVWSIFSSLSHFTWGFIYFSLQLIMDWFGRWLGGLWYMDWGFLPVSHFSPRLTCFSFFFSCY